MPLTHKRVRQLALIVGSAAGILAIAALGGRLLGGEPGADPERLSAGPAHGTACPLLVEAAELRLAGDDETFRSVIQEAARVAERTLERSGQTFGAPERLAIQLSHDVRTGRDAAVTAGLERAAEACSAIDRETD